MFEPMPRLLLGLATGFVFGFLLQKGGVAKFHVIVGQFLLRNWTAAKIMSAAVVVGALGIFPMLQLGWVELHLKPLAFGGVIAGGILFGFGIVLLGYCPGTTVAACGEGRRDAMVGVAGMLTGALFYVLLFSPIDRFKSIFADLGKKTLPELTGLPVAVWVIALGVAVFLSWFRGRRRSQTARAA